MKQKADHCIVYTINKRDIIKDPPIYQSPIALYTNGTTNYFAKSILNIPNHKVRDYVYDPKETHWHVNNEVTVKSNGDLMKLEQFHVHVPGEHTIDNVKFAIEAHFFFPDVSGSGNFLVYSVLGRLVPNDEKLSDKNIWSRILAGQSINLGQFAGKSDYFSYPGSVTGSGNPPGHFPQNVLWEVFKNVQPISQKDYDKLKLMSKIQRELQLRDGRNIIYASVDCACNVKKN
ncbi:MAG: carbonic anhydrase family protein [Hyperionvirus sp.]|uniref:Cell surface-binding protein OPG105 n=1 Tax=Hyperionvirus sp. TaxID=2487770 RepID=A0A3G5A817_9VIRU|nr:MAG: carbonic anhydrase family protein [Hyperionvirus sp.]